MLDESAETTLPISALTSLEYCPRQFYYRFVQGEELTSAAMQEGKLLHRRVHQAGTQAIAEGVKETTNLYLFSEALRLSGYADVVEERAGLLVPVEYKRGRAGPWPGDQMQLCAQALCLEERQPEQLPIPYGYIYYAGSHQRVQVPLTEELRARTRNAIVQAFAVAALESPPPPLSGKLVSRCPACSVSSVCLPDEVRLLQAQRTPGSGVLARPLRRAKQEGEDTDANVLSD
jgi:CRISPR-associated exonuclease Cas4